MTRIAICTPDLDSGDAVSNDVIGMYQAFAENGFEANAFAVNARINWPRIYPPEDIKRFLQHPRDILIYHHSVGWDKGLQILQNLKSCKVIKYHNVTPPEYFEGIASNYVIACQSGRAQLRELVKTDADLYLADSTYNLDELLTDEKPNLKHAVVPPFHHIDRLERLEADSDVLHRFDDKATHLLTVGRVVPNKGHLALIETFATYHDEYNPNSRLLIVGKEDPGLISYNRALHAKVRELHLENRVTFTGGVSDEALKAYYQTADVFVMTSLHEGFCVPLVEAMSMEIPIVAYGSTAVPETVGEVGFVWEEYDPALMAASIDRIVRDESLRLSLGKLGWNRYHRLFTDEKIRERLFEAFRQATLI